LKGTQEKMEIFERGSYFFRLAFLQICFGRVGHISGPSGPGRSSLPAVFVHFEGSTMVVKFPQTVGQHPRQEIDIEQTRDVSSTHRPRPRACGRLRVLRDARTRWHSILSHQSRGTRTVVTAPIPSAPEPTLSLLTTYSVSSRPSPHSVHGCPYLRQP